MTNFSGICDRCVPLFWIQDTMVCDKMLNLHARKVLSLLCVDCERQ